MSLSLNPLSFLSTAVESACDALLPKKFEFVGDILSLATNLRTGNIAGSIEDLQDLVQDLPQQIEDLRNKQVPPGSTPSGKAGSNPCDLAEFASTEATPPPPYGDRQLAAKSADAPPATSQDQTSRSVKNETRTAAPRQGFGPPPASFAPEALAAPPRRGAAPAPVLSAPEALSGTTADNAAASTRATSTETPAATKTDQPADAFFAMSDKDLMGALRSGSIPEAVTKDPVQMQRLQVRVSEYAQMNQLMTMMLGALHDMNKQVIQNLRA